MSAYTMIKQAVIVRLRLNSRGETGSIFESMRLKTPHQGPKRFGYDLLRHRSADTLTRYQTLCDLEQQAGPILRFEFELVE